MKSETFRKHDQCRVQILSDDPLLHHAFKGLESAVGSGLPVAAQGCPLPSVGAEDLKALGQKVFCRSSGSTERAKIIQRSAGSWIESFEINQQQLQISNADRYAVLGTPDHSLTVYAALEAMHVGADLHVLTDCTAQTQLKALKEGAVSIIYATPSLLRLLLTGTRHLPMTLPEVRLVLTGGGKLDPACRAGIAGLCPTAEILEFYGASETSFITISDKSTPIGSVGRAYPGVDITLRDSRGDLTDGIGEIWVRSPYLFDGYAEGQSADTKWDGDYLTVGELGEFDAERNLYLKGRKSRMVTVADQNVFLEDVEQALLEDTEVEMAAVIALDDPMRGAIIVGIIQGEDNARMRERLLNNCKKRLAAHAVPKHIAFLKQFPMLPAGKPDLRALSGMIDLHVREAE